MSDQLYSILGHDNLDTFRYFHIFGMGGGHEKYTPLNTLERFFLMILSNF